MRLSLRAQVSGPADNWDERAARHWSSRTSSPTAATSPTASRWPSVQSRSCRYGAAAVGLALMVSGCFTIPGSDVPDRPAIVNATRERVEVLELERPETLMPGERGRSLVAELDPGELVGDLSVAVCKDEDRALVALDAEGRLLDRWDIQDCDDDEELPEEWRITDNSRRGAPP